jgi:hypothetical protein
MRLHCGDGLSWQHQWRHFRQPVRLFWMVARQLLIHDKRSRGVWHWDKSRGGPADTFVPVVLIVSWSSSPRGEYCRSSGHMGRRCSGRLDQVVLAATAPARADSKSAQRSGWASHSADGSGCRCCRTRLPGEIPRRESWRLNLSPWRARPATVPRNPAPALPWSARRTAGWQRPRS